MTAKFNIIKNEDAKENLKPTISRIIIIFIKKIEKAFIASRFALYHGSSLA